MTSKDSAKSEMAKPEKWAWFFIVLLGLLTAAYWYLILTEGFHAQCR